MNRPSHPKKALILGSGGLRIGQAGEFDYSGSQAIKALKEEGIRTVLINPNIATVQTDKSMADEVYLQPLNLQTVTRIIEKERPDALLLSFGGQTALNLGLALEKSGVLAKYDVRVLGTPVKTIEITEDRELFKQALTQIGVKTAKSISVNRVDQALIAAEEIGYPVMMRSGFSLGGLGSGKVSNPKELRQKATEALSGAPQILIEEYLGGWKEIEYEIMRDSFDNTITVCNMENMDPMGIHTGESIVVAPSQTLSNRDYHNLREIAIRTARHLGIVGECNIQYALDPKSDEYRVIEINARLSRSSALASKATGYPLAFVACKVMLGYALHEIKNSVTQKTCAFFEPALDYLVVKMPRWDIMKLKQADRKIGSEMKSVGEVMAIGRSFPEALQKAIRMLNIGSTGVEEYQTEIDHPEMEIQYATDRRLFALYQFFQKGGTVEEAHRLSSIDPWFLNHLYTIYKTEEELAEKEPHEIGTELLKRAKKIGFSDRSIANRIGTDETTIRSLRQQLGIRPYVKQIDTLAGEFAAETNYLYTTYHAQYDDVEPSGQNPLIVLGSGPYCIGSSVEFDWCAVNTAKTLRSTGQETIIINSNPETVSTDFDESDRLYFEELTLERVSDILDYENSKGIILSMAGQIGNNLAIPLHRAGYTILGTTPNDIDRAENREKFSTLLGNLGIDQPQWEEVISLEQAKAFGKRVGYPLLVRPSYVLSGAAMNVVHNPIELACYLKEAAKVSKDHPSVISQFITGAKELEVDGVANAGEVVIQAISEHIENAGVHSGDATIVLPPQRLYLETIRKCKKITQEIARALQITGPFNIQFIAKDNEIKVIECNIRASRSFPFVSKVTNHNFIEIATKVLLGIHVESKYETLELDYVGVKAPQFSYNRLKGANPVAHVEMASTGEVACIGDNMLEAFYASWLATEQQVKKKSVLVSISGNAKVKLLESLKRLEDLGWEIYATDGTHEFLAKNGVASTFLFKASDDREPNLLTALGNREIGLIVNIPRSLNGRSESDGYAIRRQAIDHHIPLITNLQIAQIFLKCLTDMPEKELGVKSWREFTEVRVGEGVVVVVVAELHVGSDVS
jgi:carbamoyl-phosphate synthase large subunit